MLKKDAECSATYCFSLSSYTIYNIHNYYTEKIICLQFIRDTSEKNKTICFFPLLRFGTVVKLEVSRAFDLVTGKDYGLRFKSCKVML